MSLYKLEKDACDLLDVLSTASGGVPHEELVSEAIGLLHLVVDEARKGRRCVFVDGSGKERELELSFQAKIVPLMSLVKP